MYVTVDGFVDIYKVGESAVDEQWDDDDELDDDNHHSTTSTVTNLLHSLKISHSLTLTRLSDL